MSPEHFLQNVLRGIIILLAVSWVHTAAAFTVPSCPLEVENGRTIIEFAGDSIRSDMDSTAARSEYIDISLAPGPYSLTAVSYDGYESRSLDNQTDERWSVVFRNEGEIVAQSNATSDLADDVDEVVVTERLLDISIAGDVDEAVAFHAVFPSTDVNNVIPICVAIDKVSVAAQTSELDEPVSVAVVNGPEVGEEEVAITAEPVPFTYPTDDFGRCSFVGDSLGNRLDNDPAEVRKLQSFLTVYEGEILTINGVFDSATALAVIDFQEKYVMDVLAPWGLTSGTGYVGITTKHKINEIFCGKALPFTEAELATMAYINQQSAEASDMLAEVESDETDEPSGPRIVVEEYEEPEKLAIGDLAEMAAEEVVADEPMMEDVEEMQPEEVAIEEGVSQDLTTEIIEEPTVPEEETAPAVAVDEEEDAREDTVAIGTVDSGDTTGPQGIEQTAAVIVGFIDRYSLPILIVLVILLVIQVYALWRAPARERTTS